MSEIKTGNSYKVNFYQDDTYFPLFKTQEAIKSGLITNLFNRAMFVDKDSYMDKIYANKEDHNRICEVTITINWLSPDVNDTTQMVAELKKQQDKVRAEMQARINEIQNQINNLLAIES